LHDILGQIDVVQQQVCPAQEAGQVRLGELAELVVMVKDSAA
jgi:hypothetical protein